MSCNDLKNCHFFHPVCKFVYVHKHIYIYIYMRSTIKETSCIQAGEKYIIEKESLKIEEISENHSHVKVFPHLNLNSHMFNVYLILSKIVKLIYVLMIYQLLYSVFLYFTLFSLPILLIDLSISSHGYLQSNEVSIIILQSLSVELQANT